MIDPSKLSEHLHDKGFAQQHQQDEEDEDWGDEEEKIMRDIRDRRLNEIKQNYS